MNSIYEAKYLDSEEWISASFQVDKRFWYDKSIDKCPQVIYMTGWSPAPGQQKPAERGSGQVSLEDLEGFRRGDVEE